MQKVCGIVSSVFACVLFVVSASNFWRLQSRTIAPSVGELSGYVGVSLLLGLVALAGGVVCVSRAIYHENYVQQTNRPPTNFQESKPNAPPINSNDRQATRSRTWAILDELSESLRADDEASEALYVVRERYHRIQFGPINSPGTVSDKPAL